MCQEQWGVGSPWNPQEYLISLLLLSGRHKLPRARICKHFKDPRNQFPARRADMTSLNDVPARQATWDGGILKTFTNSGSDIIQRLQPWTTRIYSCFFLLVRLGAKDKVNPCMDGLNWFLFSYKRRGNRGHHESMYCKLEEFVYCFFFLKSTDDHNSWIERKKTMFFFFRKF
jgi:hypothetical protein